MSIPFAAVLAVLLSFPTYPGDKGDSLEQRTALYTPVAMTIAAVAKTPESAAALIAIARHESHLARYVLEGRCHEGPVNERCDNGRARGPWQVHPWCPATDLEGQARCVLGQFWWGYRHCGGLYAGAFASLSGRGACTWSGSSKRIATMGDARFRLALEARGGL